MNGTSTTHDTTCLTRTCLQWTPDGELSANDRNLVMTRLADFDAAITADQGIDHQPLDTGG